ncbi:MAG: hypothetical protein EKK54_12585 [Neisseriaceae bacterium]|nr:MAG: hypothetical protein EKK54_12585 [Neisseriaceae bacterium]
MTKEIFLIDSKDNKEITTVSKYRLCFDNGANISIELNDKSLAQEIVCRAWYGEKEWEPSFEASCSLSLCPTSSNSVWMKPLVLTGTSLSDVKVKFVSSGLPQIYAIENDHKQPILMDIRHIIINITEVASVIEVIMPQDNISPLFQESVQIITNDHAIVCEPKAANLWVFKNLTI